VGGGGGSVARNRCVKLGGDLRWSVSNRNTAYVASIAPPQHAYTEILDYGE
jgi:hypothetical protein